MFRIVEPDINLKGALKVNLADMMIYFDHVVHPEDRAKLEQELRQVAGVIAPRFNPSQDRLLLVSYDPEKTSSYQLLARLHAIGFTGRLVGL